MKFSIKHELKIAGVALAVGLLFALLAAGYTYAYAMRTQANIADNVIRFHVRANSDGAECQALKYRIRDEVLAEFEHYFATDTVYNARNKIAQRLDTIQTFAQDVANSAGYNYTVTANIARLFFPTQFYGSIAFPPGEYEALQIIIGDGEGNNWWCLMFPPLCYVDMTATEEGRGMLSAAINDEGMRLLMHQDPEEVNTGLVVRFRIVEWWQNRRQPTQHTNPPAIARS